MHARGDQELSGRLATAFDIETDEESTRAHVHGFHSYPARMHPTVARRMIELLSEPGATVLDPFCGSGTVLVEGRIAGRLVVGNDLNPLAVALARLKTRGASEAQLKALVETAHQVQEHATDRRKKRLGATRRYPEADVQLFDPHVLLELDSLRDKLEQLPTGFARETLWLVLSAILIKVSKRPGDTAERTDSSRRLAAGFTTKLFGRKAEELARQLAAFTELLPPGVPQPAITQGDARQLRPVVKQPVDLVVTSPPYAGNYDYAAQHGVRMRWLGMNPRSFEQLEIGARRKLEPLGHAAALRSFGDDMQAVFRAVRPLMRPAAKLVIVVADSVVERRPIWAESLVIRAAERAGLKWLATASQDRPHFHAASARSFSQQPRREHAVLLAVPETAPGRS